MINSLNSLSKAFQQYTLAILVILCLPPLLASDDAVPQKWLESRGAFYESTLALANARDLSESPDGDVIFVLPEETRGKIRKLEQKGLLLSAKIDNDFLDWVLPGLRSQYRDHLIAGTELFVKGVKANDLGIQVAGKNLILKWCIFWEENGSQIADKLYPNLGS